MVNKKKVVSFFLCGLFSVFFAVPVFSQNMFRKINDFDGDGRADFAVTRSVGGTKVWYILQSTNGFASYQYGFDTDENTAGDYDGDGKTDRAVFRKEVVPPGLTRYAFWIQGSQDGPRNFTFTTNTYPNSVAHHQDYEGDGKTDVAWTIENNARYFVAYSTGGSNGIFSPANGGTFIKIGDIDGDNKAEAAAYNVNHLVFVRHSTTDTIYTEPFGIAGDIYVPADFDGDAKGDLTVFRPSNGQWWWIRSSDHTAHAATFGAIGDKPVPADYDGDGKTDLAIWRRGAQSHYWVYGSQIGVFVLAWGIFDDTVVHY